MNNEIQRLFKLLLNHEFWETHQHKLPEKSFDEIGQSLLKTVKHTHDTYKRSIRPEEVLLMHVVLNPTLTTANKNTVEQYLTSVKEVDAVAEDIGHEVFKSMWRKEVGRVIAEHGVRLIDGSVSDVDDISSFLSKISGDFIPADFNEGVTTDPVALFNLLKEQGKWNLNLPYLDSRIRNIRPGTFIILLARPESGKTATIVNLMAGKGGFAAQGANVHLLANEEGAEATVGRAICCYNEISSNQAIADPQLANTDGWRELRKKVTFVHQPEMTLSQLDYYCKRHKPDVLIVDQLDHVMINHEFNRGDERLGGIYRRFREILSIHGVVGIGVSQASAEAEGKTKINFAMAEGSKTSKAAAADLIIGLGKADENTTVMEEGNEVNRYFTISKNKLSGWKGTVTCKLIQDQSRFIP